MTMVMKTISASEFKAKSLALLDEVAETGETIVVTKRGKPVAQVGPVEQPPSLRGSMKQLVSDEEFIKPIDVEWDVLKD
jgi:prevent-host-death family protein